MKVAVVDDSASIRERLRDMVGEVPGVEIVGEVGCAREALEILPSLQPDVVILDIRMPDGSGIEVLRYLKQHHPAPTVIMLTNYAWPEYRIVCKAAGADYFFDKSWEFANVVRVLQDLTNHGNGTAG